MDIRVKPRKTTFEIGDHVRILSGKMAGCMAEVANITQRIDGSKWIPETRTYGVPYTTYGLWVEGKGHPDRKHYFRESSLELVEYSEEEILESFNALESLTRELMEL